MIALTDLVIESLPVASDGMGTPIDVREWRVSRSVPTCVMIVVATVPIYLALGSEFMPPLNNATSFGKASAEF